MDGDRFDALALALARRQCRRTLVLRFGLAGINAGILGRIGSPPDALALPARQEGCSGYPWRECDGLCVNIETDPNHCGGCGVGCVPGESCSAGSCSLCGPLNQCGEACVDLQSDPAHCGGCGVRCHNWEACISGQCYAEPVDPGPPQGCPSGLTLCDGFCIDIQRDDEHCGGCRVRCQPLLMECREGRCVVLEDPCWPSVC